MPRDDSAIVRETQKYAQALGLELVQYGEAGRFRLARLDAEGNRCYLTPRIRISTAESRLDEVARERARERWGA